MLHESQYETVVVEPGAVIYGLPGDPPWGVCADVWNGKAVLLRPTHHDCDVDDLIRVAERNRRIKHYRNKSIDCKKGKC